MNGTKEITEADVVSDFNKLKNINIKTISMLSLVGNKTVNYFTLNERLNTKTKTGISFLDFLKNIYKYNECNYYERFMQNNEHFSLIKNQYSYFKMYHGSICIFKPLIAMQIYDIYKPQSVLDPTMGWGGRLVGAGAANVPHYIGIDNNEKLNLLL